MIYFIRHGESEANQNKVFAGQKDDSLLTKKGREQARSTAKEILTEGIQIDRIITSPLKRAVETAQIIAQEIGFDISDIIQDERITEYDLGSLSGTPWTPVINVSEVLGAEDPYALKDRILSCLTDVSKLSGNTLLSGHGISGRMIKTIKEGGDPKDFSKMPTLENASILKIDWI